MSSEDFSRLFDFLADRKGEKALIEAGVDEGSAERPQLTFPLSVRAILGEVTRDNGVGPGMTLHLQGTAGNKDRLWLDPNSIAAIDFIAPTTVRVWLAGGDFISVASSTRTDP